MKSKLIIPFLVLIITSSCKKNWLDAKPDLSLAVPSTLADYQAILNFREGGFGTAGISFNDPQTGFGELSAGDFYVSDASLTARPLYEQSVYLWASDVYQGINTTSEWNYPYQRILKTNVVLEGIDNIIPQSGGDMIMWRDIKGSALFFRAYNHYTIAQLFCKPYNKSTAEHDLGIPLRLSSDFNIPSKRATVQETYSQILSDLKQSLSIVPMASPSSNYYKFSPTKAAVSGMLARVYLSMSNYDSALVYANTSLGYYSTLIDYNNTTAGIPSASTINPNSNVPFAKFNDEVIFQMRLSLYAFFTTSRLIVDQGLLNSYDVNDWRKDAFFRTVNNNKAFKGSYDGSATFFSGIATDELYLIRAECYARTGNMILALNDLNTLYQKRWKNSVLYQPITAVDANDALRKVLVERRKELCFRGIRWTDLRRLNMDPQFAVTLNRFNNNQNYTLPPNDLRYVFLIPPDVINLSGIPQNPR